MILPGITSNWASKNAKKVESLQNKGSIAGIGKIVGGLFDKSTAVGNVPPHDHDSPKDTNRITPREDSIPPIPPPNPDNITGNLTNNQIIQDKGKALWQGDQFANQYASRPPVDPATPVSPQPDPIGDQYGNMFNPPFAQNGDFKKYETGELLDADDFSEISGQIGLAAEKYSDIQEDKKGQYVTSLGSRESYTDFKRPTSSKHIDQWSEKEVERDTIRPRSGKTFISTWKKNK